MLTLSELYQLERCYPHLTHTLPAACIIEFQVRENCSISANTQLCIKTNNGSNFRLSTAYDFNINNRTHHLIDSSDKVFENYSRLVESGYTPYLAHIHPYQLLLDFCNRPQLLCSFIIHPSQLQPITTSEIKPNCCLAINYFKQQSEPIRINSEQLEYKLEPELNLNNTSIKLCSAISTFFLSPQQAYKQHGQIISLPLECHQPSLYKSCDKNNTILFNNEIDNIESIVQVTEFYPPLQPQYSLSFGEALSIANFNFLYSTNHTQQLKSLIQLHQFKYDSTIDALIESIACVHLTPVQPTKLRYTIIFKHETSIQILFIEVMRHFFKLLHPINLSILVDYAVQSL